MNDPVENLIKSRKRLWQQCLKWSRRISKENTPEEQRNVLIKEIRKNPYRILKIPLFMADELGDIVGITHDHRHEYRWMGELIRLVDCNVRGKTYSLDGVENDTYKNDIGLIVGDQQYNALSRPANEAEVFKNLRKDYSLKQVITINNCGIKKQIIVSESIFYKEKNLAHYLKTQTQVSPHFYSVTREEIIEIIIKQGKNPTDELVKAIFTTITSRVSIITGEAGTGKTVAIQVIYKLCKKYQVPFRTCAFTGKAIANLMQKLSLSEEEEFYFTTLHYLLYGVYKRYYRDIQKPNTETKFMWQDNEGPFFLVLEEVSMIPSGLLSTLLTIAEKLHHNFQIVLVGDANQLPPIGWGQFFNCVLRSNIFPISTLEENHRMKHGTGTIIKNSRLFKQTTISGIISWEKDIFDNSPYHLHKYLDYYKDIDNYNRVGIISPWRARKDIINSEAQKYIHAGITNRLEWNEYGTIKRFYVNDKIIVGKNNRVERIYNGSEGIIVSVNKQGNFHLTSSEKNMIYKFLPPGEMELRIFTTSSGWVFCRDKPIAKLPMEIPVMIITARINDRDYDFPVIYEDSEEKDKDEEKPTKSLTIQNLDLAYCITTHKAQGLEKELIILDCEGKTWASTIPGGVANVYTAITRPRDHFYYRGNPQLLIDSKKYKNPITHDRLTLLLTDNIG